MNSKLISFVFCLLSFFFFSCTAINSTVNAIGRNITSAFSTPREIPNKITDPRREDARLAILWVGHATTLIQIDDKFILTDPVFTTTVGQFSKRLVEPGIDPQHLPDLDAVLISHLHIDHLSLPSLRMIEKKTGQLMIPKGGLIYIPDYHFNINELTTWQTWEEEGLKITAVPVDHNGWRYGLDAAWMKTSYTGYLIEYHGIRVYFGGDTAYDSTLFHQTGRMYPNIEAALLPIAPINPREYSMERHTDPKEALQIIADLGAKRLIPIHYDTFPESLDSLGEATATLKAEMNRQGINQDKVVILDIGEQSVLIRRREEKPVTWN